MSLLDGHHHACWVLLSASFSYQLDYLLTLQYPSEIEGSARSMEARLWEVLENLAGQPRIPQGEEGLGVECVLDLSDVDSLQGRLYQRLIAAQPIKLEGLGRRELVETIPAAFIGGVEQALAFFAGGRWGGRARPLPPTEAPGGQSGGSTQMETFSSRRVKNIQGVL